MLRITQMEYTFSSWTIGNDYPDSQKHYVIKPNGSLVIEYTKKNQVEYKTEYSIAPKRIKLLFLKMWLVLHFSNLHFRCYDDRTSKIKILYGHTKTHYEEFDRGFAIGIFWKSMGFRKCLFAESVLTNFFFKYGDGKYPTQQ